MKLKFCVIGLAVSVLVAGYGISTISSANDNGKIYKTIDTIRGYFEINNDGETMELILTKGMVNGKNQT